MKPQKLIIILSVSIGFMCLTIIGIKIYQNESNFQLSQQERLAEENRILQEISAKTDLEPSWLAIREYIYCDFLQKGMKRSEVEDGLAKISEILNWETQISFADPVIESKLGPVMVLFSFPGPNGELLKWGRSPDANYGAQIADCERDQHFESDP